MRTGRRGPSAPHRPPLGRDATALVLGYGVSSAGTGLVSPFTTVYLSTVVGLRPAAVAAVLGLTAFSSLSAGLAAGLWTARADSRRVMLAGLGAQAAGSAVLALAGVTAPAAPLGAAVQGVGNGLFYAAAVPVIAGVVDAARQSEVFALRYLATNLGLGAGALLGGAVIARWGSPGYPVLYLTNAVSYLALVTVLGLLAPGRSGPPPAAPPPPATPDGPAAEGPAALRDAVRAAFAPLADRSFRLLLVLQALVVVSGFAQLDSAVPLYLSADLHLPVQFIGIVIATNTLLVVVLQLPAARWTASPAGTTGTTGTTGRVSRAARAGTRSGGLRSHPLRTLGLLWAVADVAGLVAGWLPGAGRPVAVLVYVAVFSLGECLYSPAFPPLLVSLAGQDRIGPCSALASMTWTGGLIVGPAAGTLLVLQPWPPLYWLCLGACALAVAAVASRAVPPDGPAPSGPRSG